MARLNSGPRRIFLPLLLLAFLGVVVLSVVAFSPSQWGERVRSLPSRVQARVMPQPTMEAAFVPTPAALPGETEVALAALLATVTSSSPSQSATPTPTREAPTATVVARSEGLSGQSVAAAITRATEAQPTLTPAPPTTTPTATAIPIPTVPVTAIQPRVELTNVSHEYQGWNNCGPVTISMAVSYFGRKITQKESAPVLKPDPNDKNVGPDEMAEYARTLGLNATYRVNGNLLLLKTLLSNDLPVIVEHWFIPEPNDEMGHYKLFKGYDEAAQVFFANDSYNGPNLRVAYAEFDALWKVFNRTYVVVYPPEREVLVRAIIGADTADQGMWERSLAGAQTDVTANQADRFAWFNLGSSLTALGRQDEAARAFDQARRLNLPWRMLWYQFGPFEAYAAVGRWQDVLALADANLKTANNLEESHFYRGQALQALGRADEARQAYQQAVTFNQNYRRAQEALAKLALNR